MPHDLATLGLSGMTQLGARLRALGDGATSMEEVSQRTCELLHDELVDGAKDEKACALVRAYVTIPFGHLDDELQAFGRGVCQGEVAESVRCLTLLGTRGLEPAWNDRRRSRGHRAIPLPSEEAIARLPMVAQLVSQLGVDVAAIVRPSPGLILEAERRTYNVFYVEEARGSPFIPAQDEFVVPHGIRSVIGYGGLLPTGEVFAILLFARVRVERATADVFRNAAMNSKLSFLPFCDGRVLGPKR